ncbi:MAG: leucine-rich repeat protein [Clostridiales bacterium]|nr:leucine-rich repeat protein [Candidatus Cacconaster stercorequi]
MQHKRKTCLLSAILMLMLVLTLVPATAFAATVVDSGSYESLTYKLTDDGILTISGKGEVRNPNGYNTPWAEKASLIKQVVIQKGVTGVGVDAFRNCKNLEKVTLPEGYARIDVEQFSLCSKLKEITIPSTVKYIGAFAFSNDSALRTVKFLGNAPTFNGPTDLGELKSDSPIIFYGVTATCYYPAGNTTWTSSARKNYGGTLTWKKAAMSAPAVSITIKADSGKPHLTWPAVSGAAKYEVWRATSKSGTYTKYYTTTGNSYTNTSAVAGDTYYYKVRAIDSNGKVGSFSTIHYITCDCARPTVIISTVASTGKPHLKWQAVSGAGKYEIWRATSKSGSYSKYYTTTSTQFTNISAVVDHTYYYKVKAVCTKSSYGNSAFSSIKSITCVKAK